MEGGVNVAVSSEIAESVDVCLFAADGSESRVRLPERTAHVWHGFLPDVGVGQRYGLRVNGPWDPGHGLRCNSAKLLIDPHATAIDGEVKWGPELFGHDQSDPDQLDGHDSAPSMPKCVVTERSYDWEGDAPPGHPLAATVIYEAHVKGLTQRHPDVPDELRGTYAGVAHAAVTGYLTELGVTAIELLPVHQFVHDSHLVEKGLRNYWGYNSIGFLAPHGG
jgi:isoamylase